MPASQNATYLAQLINPQVMADMISAELPNAIVLAPLAVVGRTLQGRAGNTITVPVYTYIGDATTVAEGADIPIAQLTTDDSTVTVQKAGRGVELTDEAILSGFGDPVGEATNQLKMSIANKVDNDLFGILRGNTVTLAATVPMTIPGLLAGKAKFGEKVNQTSVIIMNSTNYVKIATEILPFENTDKVLIDGTVGRVAGMQVAISDKLSDTEAFIVAPGALGIELKRDVQVESDRDIVAKTTVITADEHYAVYLKDASKAIKLTISAS